MNADVFLDTNIVVYAFDRNCPAKRNLARELIAIDASWSISWQVVQEFCSVALHRFTVPLTHEFLDEMISLVLQPHCHVMPSPALWKNALHVRAQTQYRFYDSLIVAAALESGARILYSEDLQPGRRIGNLEIVNPFPG